MDLPIDIVVKILLRLPVESLCRIRCVSKTLLNKVDSLSFVRQYTLSLVTGNNHVVQVPQLMCFAYTSPSDGEEDTTSVTLQSLRYDGGTALTKGEYTFTHSTSSPFHTSYSICFVFYNLLCMAWEDGHCLLINPLRREVLSLPTDSIEQLTKYGPNSEVHICWYGMGFDYITNTYKIVRISRILSKEPYSTIGMFAHVLVLGTSSWREISSVPPCLLNRAYNICAYGDMHWLVKAGGAIKSHIISFDFKNEEFCWTPTPPTLQSSNRDSKLHLLTLRGSMAIVETFSLPEGGMNVEIWVMKDYAKKEWAREYNINVDMRPEFELKYATCGEWEHGIFFNDLDNSLKSNGITRFFLDLRCDSINLVTCPLETEQFSKIMSYSGSLISLRDYGTEPNDELVT